jgi:GNAT superfamily N-acetyltransferase
MNESITILQARADESASVASILRESADWLTQSGMPLWRDSELETGRIAADVGAGLFFLAEKCGEAAGTVKFQLEDAIFWPDVPGPDAAYVHRLAVRRRYAGTGLSTAILSWAVARTRELGRHYLRLDTDAARPRLRAVYERFGFVHHSDRQAGVYFVARYEYDLGKSAKGLPSDL